MCCRLLDLLFLYQHCIVYIYIYNLYHYSLYKHYLYLEHQYSFKSNTPNYILACVHIIEIEEKIRISNLRFMRRSL
jgi:hypothetical protein